MAKRNARNRDPRLHASTREAASETGQKLMSTVVQAVQAHVIGNKISDSLKSKVKAAGEKMLDKVVGNGEVGSAAQATKSKIRNAIETGKEFLMGKTGAQGTQIDGAINAADGDAISIGSIGSGQSGISSISSGSSGSGDVFMPKAWAESAGVPMSGNFGDIPGTFGGGESQGFVSRAINSVKNLFTPSNPSPLGRSNPMNQSTTEFDNPLYDESNLTFDDDPSFFDDDAVDRSGIYDRAPQSATPNIQAPNAAVPSEEPKYMSPYQRGTVGEPAKLPVTDPSDYKRILRSDPINHPGDYSIQTPIRTLDVYDGRDYGSAPGPRYIEGEKFINLGNVADEFPPNYSEVQPMITRAARVFRLRSTVDQGYSFHGANERMLDRAKRNLKPVTEDSLVRVNNVAPQAEYTKSGDGIQIAANPSSESEFNPAHLVSQPTPHASSYVGSRADDIRLDNLGDDESGDLVPEKDNPKTAESAVDDTARGAIDVASGASKEDAIEATPLRGQSLADPYKFSATSSPFSSTPRGVSFGQQPDSAVAQTPRQYSRLGASQPPSFQPYDEEPDGDDGEEEFGDPSAANAMLKDQPQAPIDESGLEADAVPNSGSGDAVASLADDAVFFE